MRAHARADSSADTRPASSWLSLQSELRIVVRQNARRSHVKLKDSQIRILLYFFNELISESSCVRFAIDGNLPRRLVVCRNSHLGRWQTFENVQQNFDRVITRIERRSQCLPVRFRRADELRTGSVMCNARVKPPYLKSEQAQVRKQEKQKRKVSATDPDEPLSPFCLPNRL